MTSLHAVCVFMTWTLCYVCQMYANCTGIFCYCMVCYVCNMHSYRNAYWLFPYCIPALCQLKSTVPYIAKCILFSVVWHTCFKFKCMHFSNWFSWHGAGVGKDGWVERSHCPVRLPGDVASGVSVGGRYQHIHTGSTCVKHRQVVSVSNFHNS